MIVSDVKNIVSAFLALGAISVLISLAFYFTDMKNEVSEEVTVRQISLAAPPPPPPPAIKKAHSQSVAAPELQLEVSGSGAIMQIDSPTLPTQLSVNELPEVKVQTLSSNLFDSLSMDWHSFGLSELDETPHLLTQLSVHFPANLKRKGIKIVNVELDVMIIESGKVLLRGVVDNPYPELERILKQLVSQARFSVPKKDGIAVRAGFYWPLELSDS